MSEEVEKMSEKPYTVHKLADIWGMDESAIYKLIKRGELIGFRVGKAIRITPEEVENYQQRNKTWQDQNSPDQTSNLEDTKENPTGTSNGHGRGYQTAYQRAQKMKSQQSSTF